MSAAPGTIARRFVVRGRVQGVAFRWATRQAAERLGVAGWVRNRPDGSVEAWAESDEPGIEALTAFLHEGPRAAAVESVTVEDAVPTGRKGFEIRS